MGEKLVAGCESNFEPGRAVKDVDFTATFEAATWGAELASGEDGRRTYVVEPMGEFEDHPNVTDKRLNPGSWARCGLADWTRWIATCHAATQPAFGDAPAEEDEKMSRCELPSLPVRVAK